jgi:signal transduction histidine kinase/ActR/RegA family two-component response regulator
MTDFRDLPIQRKLLLATLISTAAALLLAGGGFVSWDIVQFRSAVRQDLTAQSATIAENSGAPLAFGDESVGREILSVSRVWPQVEMACLYKSDGSVFTSYRRGPEASCPTRIPRASTFGWEAFDVVAPVTVDRARVGTLYIRRNLGDLYTRLRVGTTAICVLLLLAVGAAAFTANRMQRSIASPLLQLADTARTISTTRNYALRATSSSRDEIGIVVRSFNEMLDRIADALERERHANRIKDEFLATLSHELRTPLNAVLGWARVLRANPREKALHAKALEAIERNARIQALLIEDLLDMSRITSGKPRMTVHEVDLTTIVNASVDAMRPAAAAKRLDISVDIGARPAYTMGDSGRLHQIVWNLLSNAVKYTPSGGRVTVGLEQADGYRLTVSDTGTGIDPDFLPVVFEPFRQADASTTREHGGLGLGLAITKHLVELHGGTITARSAGRGAGATFEVRLPSVITYSARPARPDPLLEPVPPMRLNPSMLHGLQVLVVDDDEDARVLLETTLAQHGANVRTASSAAQAWSEIERRPPDVLLSDIAMPHEDGYALIRRLRERPPSRGGATPAIAVTAYASAGDRQQTAAAGYQAHIAKPFEPSAVVQLVSQLAHAQSRRS